MADELVQVTLSRTRETKRIVRFETDDDAAAVRDVYLRKDAAAALGERAQITFTVAAQAAEPALAA